MCVVSAMIDYGQRVWPNGFIDPVPPYTPLTRPLPNPAFKLEEHKYIGIKEYLELVKKAKQFDDITNQPHCEDPKKVEFLRNLLDRIDTVDEELNALKAYIRKELKLEQNEISQ